MNEVLLEEKVKMAVHGSYSGFHVYTNPDKDDITPGQFDATAYIAKMINAKKDGFANALRMGMLVNGVDVNSGPSGTISATHGDDEMAVTIDAFRSTIRALKREGALS
jgi:glutamate-1-semialdehyde 2,1-aminomutase